MAEGAESGIVISRGWLAITSTLIAIVMGLGSWGVSQTVGRSTMTLQIETLERRLEAMDTRGEARRASTDLSWRSFEERMASLSDRLARVEVRLDTGAGLEPRRSRTSLECWQGGMPAVPAILRWTRP